MALFSNNPSSSRGGGSKNIVEFRAGKMHLKGTTVHPDKRKGLVYVYQADDSLMHFCWKDRTAGKVEDDLIIFPDDCELKRVPQCTTGRVYLLKFKSTNRKLFFWMQEPKADKDEDHCKKVNDTLNNPPKPGQSSSSGTPDLSNLDSINGGNLQELFNNVDHQQLLQMMTGGGLGAGGLGNLLNPGGSQGGSMSSHRSGRNQSSSSTPQRSSASSTPARPATTTGAGSNNNSAPAAAPATPAAPAASQPTLQLSHLQDILSNMGAVPKDGAGGPTGGAPKPEVNLAEAITPEKMIPILADSQVQERLKPFLPQGETIGSTEEELRATVHSPHFRSAMSSFSSALATGQLGPALAQFALPEAAQEAASRGDVAGFAKAMQEDAAKNKE